MKTSFALILALALLAGPVLAGQTFVFDGGEAILTDISTVRPASATFLVKNTSSRHLMYVDFEVVFTAPSGNIVTCERRIHEWAPGSQQVVHAWCSGDGPEEGSTIQIWLQNHYSR